MVRIAQSLMTRLQTQLASHTLHVGGQLRLLRYFSSAVVSVRSTTGIRVYLALRSTRALAMR